MKDSDATLVESNDKLVPPAVIQAQPIKFTLVSRCQSLLQPTLLNSIYSYTSKSASNIFDLKVVVPEHVIFKCCEKILNQADKKVSMDVKALDGGILMADDVFSEYPCLIIGDKVIQKDNITIFMKKVTDINDKFRGAGLVGQKGVQCLEKIKRLEVMCQTQLHLVTKYNFHKDGWISRNALSWIFNPLTQLRNKRDLYVLLSMSQRYQDVRLDRAESRYNMAKRVHDELENALKDDLRRPNRSEDVEYQRTFFDACVPKEEEKEVIDNAGQDQSLRELRLNPCVQFSSLDMTVYAYLKEEIVNTGDSQEVKYLMEQCPALMKFYGFMDSLFNEKSKDDGEMWKLFRDANGVKFTAELASINQIYNLLHQRSDTFQASQKSQNDGKIVIQQSNISRFFNDVNYSDSEDEEEEEDDEKPASSQPKTEEQKSKDEAAKTQEQKAKAKKKELEVRMYRNAYSALIMSCIFLYLNFAKNPFNREAAEPQPGH